MTGLISEFLHGSRKRLGVEADLALCEVFWESSANTDRFRRQIIDQVLATKRQYEYEVEQQKEKRDIGEWTCFCTTVNSANTRYCTTCGTRRGEKIDLASQQFRV